MAQITNDRARTALDEQQHAHARLEAAFAERDRCRQRYEATLGTSCELAAYMRLRQASDHVAACDKWLRWVESEDHLRALRPDRSALDELLVAH